MWQSADAPLLQCRAAAPLAARPICRSADARVPFLRPFRVPSAWRRAARRKKPAAAEVRPPIAKVRGNVKMGGLRRVPQPHRPLTSSRVATIARKSFPLAHASTRPRGSCGAAASTFVSVPVVLRDDKAGGVLARCEEGGSPGGSSNERCEGRGVSCIPSCSSRESRGTSASGSCRADCDVLAAGSDDAACDGRCAARSGWWWW